MSVNSFCRLFLCLFFGVSTWAQNGNISGTITFENSKPAIGVVVYLIETDKVAITDNNGNYTIDNISYGNYIIETSTIEAEKKTISVVVNKASVKLNITLKKTNGDQLDEVIVNSINKKKEIETKGFAVNVIETKEAGLRSLQTNELLDRTVGVRIRQNGGLGSEVNYNINGMSGNAVRIFIDGIPISTYGSSFDLNSIPPSMIERIEVYKGVIPGHLSDDALGGAINVVLKKGARNNFNASFSYGSFNTAQANLNGVYRFEESGFTVKATGFWNYSDNDYEVWGDKVYNILPNGRYEYIRAKRFNDAFKSIGGVVEVGFTDTKWADNFFVGFTRSDSYKEVQHGTFMTTPYKGRFMESDANLLHLTYNKKNLFTEGLEFNVYAIHGERNRMINDTVKWNYNWSGKRSLNLNGLPIVRPQGAQQGTPTIANIKRKVSSVRSGLAYAINDNHKFLFNHIFQVINREDDDELRSVLERNFFGTRYLNKNIVSLSYELTAFDNALKTTVFGKYYQQKIKRTNPVVQNIGGEQTVIDDVVSSNKNANGFGAAVSYAILPNITLLTSAEQAIRLPNENEVFGDAGDNISENPGIKAETSKNINLGFRLGTFTYKKNAISLTTNFFYRNIQDRIGTQVQTSLNNNVQTLPFVNQGDVTSKGFDLELNYIFNNNLNIIVSTSKFDLTYKNIYNERKVPNEPTFTANASTQYSLNNVLQKNSKLNLFYNVMFVDTFSYILLPYGNNSGLDRFETPQQFIHDLGLSYVFPNKKFIASFDAKNIFDKQAFDNFAVQKPGRAFYLKINYIINNF